MRISLLLRYEKDRGEMKYREFGEKHYYTSRPVISVYEEGNTRVVLYRDVWTGLFQQLAASECYNCFNHNFGSGTDINGESFEVLVGPFLLVSVGVSRPSSTSESTWLVRLTDAYYESKIWVQAARKGQQKRMCWESCSVVPYWNRALGSFCRTLAVQGRKECNMSCFSCFSTKE